MAHTTSHGKARLTCGNPQCGQHFFGMPPLNQTQVCPVCRHPNRPNDDKPETVMEATDETSFNAVVDKHRKQVVDAIEKHRDHIIKLANERDEFIQLEDGDFYYWCQSVGAINATDLRILADELDRRNKHGS